MGIKWNYYFGILKTN